MGKPGKTGIQRIIDAFGYSMQGLRAALKHESAFRQEAALFIILLPVAIWLGRHAIEWALLLGSLLLVLIVELLNSAIEAAVDRFGDEFNNLAGRAKDMGSAAVFLSMMSVVVVWSLIIYQRFFA